MPIVLALDTSTKGCSAALFDGQDCLVHRQVIEDGFVHAEQLHLIVDTLFKEMPYSLKDIDAVAVGAGPGSYTGLRIGVSAAKGFAFALDKELIGVDSLALLAQHCRSEVETKNLGAEVILSVIDSRRQEVYARIQRLSGEVLLETSSIDLEDFSLEPYVTGSSSLIVVGDAIEKMRTYLKVYDEHHSITLLEAYPNAKFMGNFIQSAFEKRAFESLISFEPNYIKPVYITQPKSSAS
ncbi:MAG: tRNA (adenosine(37)-N6)-threonylcarbamoyltransferase complex dimerization subunit type 1 TsaB [Flavobacteriaceae bacterium]